VLDAGPDLAVGGVVLLFPSWASQSLRLPPTGRPTSTPPHNGASCLGVKFVRQ
jgi:hypothetical protein